MYACGFYPQTVCLEIIETRLPRPASRVTCTPLVLFLYSHESAHLMTIPVAEHIVLNHLESYCNLLTKAAQPRVRRFIIRLYKAQRQVSLFRRVAGYFCRTCYSE